MTTTQIAIEHIDIDELRPDPANPRGGLTPWHRHDEDRRLTPTMWSSCFLEMPFNEARRLAIAWLSAALVRHGAPSGRARTALVVPPADACSP
jgi:hypothetical protein